MKPPKDNPEPGGGIRQRLRRLPLGVIAGGAVLAAVILFVAAPLNIAARIGPYPGIGWLLHTYMKQWARNWSFGVEKPRYVDLSHPGMIRLGAGYFETGCAACHGAPGRDRNPLVTRMEPPPPTLASREMSDFSDRELYWIVWNGVRYTAMPGWSGDNREDEVWAMVAFLRNYGSIAPQDYVHLAYGEVDSRGVGDGGAMRFGGPGNRLDETVQNCARCHGDDGMGREGTAPRIAGQSKEYLTATLEGYASGRRPSGFMQPIAAPLSRNEIAALAAHYADKHPVRAASAAEVAPGDDTQGDLLALGKRLAAEGDPPRFVPGCVSCHEGSGQVAPRAEYPRIKGQERRFIEAWLRLYRDGPMGGTEFANVMHFAARGLSDHQISALAAWYASQPYEAGARDQAQAVAPE